MESGRSLADSLAHLKVQGHLSDPGIALSPGNIPLQPQSSVDLQKMLIDERMRCETHKTNYETLKEEHRKVQDENTKLKHEIGNLHSNGIHSTEQLQSLVNELQNRLAIKNRELEEVRGQTMNPHKLGIIKAEISKELEEPLKAHMVTMDKEVEKYRGEYNKLRYEHTFMKAEYEHAKAEHHRNLEEQALRHQAQVASLQHERDELLKMQKSAPDGDAQKLIQLQRQKTQLDQRVKNLLDEMSELRKQKERSATESDLIQRSQAKDLSTLHANIKQIESEKRSTEMQCDRLQKELRDKADQNIRLNQQIQELNKECAQLRNMADEESHQHKMSLTNQKLEFMQTRGVLEREKDSLSNKLHELETELDVARVSVSRHTREVEDMERDYSLKLQQAREEEWNKNNQMQNQKLQTEERCRELEQRLLADRESRDREREEQEERSKSLERNEAQLKSELAKIELQLDHEKQMTQQLERDRHECATLRQKLSERDKEMQAVTSSRQQLLGEAERTKEALRLARSDVENCRMQAVKAQNEAEKSNESDKLVWMEEKHRLQTKLDQVEYKIKKQKEESDRGVKQQRKIKHALIEKARNLRGKNELLEAEKEQLEIELKAGRHGVSMEEHNRMRRRMREQRRRHNEFRRVMGLSETLPQLSSTAYPDMTSFNATDMTNNYSMYAQQEKRNLEEFRKLRERLDEIEEKNNKEKSDVMDENKEYEDDFASESSHG